MLGPTASQFVSVPEPKPEKKPKKKSEPKKKK